MIPTPGSPSAATLPDILPHITIIGGGITGMSAAYALQREARASGRPVQITLIERDARLGGKIATDRVRDCGEFVVEHGPDSFVTQKPQALELAVELGLSDRLIAANELPRKTFVLVKGRRVPLPEGLSLLVPTKLGPFLRSPLFSPAAKLRIALERFVPPRRESGDETIADFVRRRFGQEMLERLGEPLLGGIHSCQVERQSMQATFPRFVAMEQQHGSLLAAAQAALRNAPATSAPLSGPAKLRRAAFVTLKGGMAELVEALALRLEARVLTGRAVTAVEPGDGAAYRVLLDDGTLIPTDALIITTPAYNTAKLVAPFAPDLAAGLRRIRYVSTGIATLAFRRSEIRAPIDGFGLVIPGSEGRRINACTLTSVKFDHRAPADTLLVRVFFGGSDTPEAMQLDDAALLELVRSELKAVLGIDAAPLWTRIYRWWDSNPQYDLGHLERVDALHALCPPGLLLAGSAYRGVGIPDCIRQGYEAAERVQTYVIRNA
ncbi:MAG TPA: protoporphyrinogen oxidase [Roseiflexaceae bacterium]|nr:protoporphyrinogen oxidase [Roseiflexaceae bacterium]